MAMLREHIRKVTAKGQVTIPAAIRDLLDLRPGEKVVFRIVGDRVEIAAAPMSLDDAFGSVEPLQRPEDFDTLREKALAEHAEKVMREMKES
jgi:AbrB family looped-hinge helix DNA binding protein